MKSSKRSEAAKKAVASIYKIYGKDAFVKMGKKAAITRKKNALAKKRSESAKKAWSTRLAPGYKQKKELLEMAKSGSPKPTRK